MLLCWLYLYVLRHIDDLWYIHSPRYIYGLLYVQRPWLCVDWLLIYRLRCIDRLWL